MKLDGVRLRAVNLALRDFLPEPGSAAKCEDRQHSYDLVVWLAEDPLHGTPGLVYVELYLRPGACEGVPDRSAIYAIDVEQWRIAATRP